MIDRLRTALRALAAARLTLPQDWRGQARLIGAVFMKEALETIRDRRTVVVALLLPVVMMPIVQRNMMVFEDRKK